MKPKKLILLAVVVVVSAAAITGYLFWNKPHKNVKDADAAEVSATDLYTAFTKDSTTARSAYIDKILAVHGTVSSISENQQKQPVILLQTAVPDASINCTMEQNPVPVKPGDPITIKAICSGYIAGDESMGIPGDVYLVRGYIKS